MSSNAAAAKEPVSKSFFGGGAIGGHDTVAYRRQKNGEHRANEGDSDYMIEWKGARWCFANQADGKAFAADPEKYSPAYNVFFANALGLGNGLVKIDDTPWQIYDNQLYLFYSKEGRDQRLSRDYKEFKAVADKVLQAILASE